MKPSPRLTINMSSNNIPDMNGLRVRELRAPRYTSYPTALEFREHFPADTFFGELARTNDEPVPVPLSLYVHVPYCAAACFYCGCHRVISRNTKTHAAYVDRLLAEIEQTLSLIDRDRPIQQIHFGGGTPNLLRPEDLKKILQALTRRNKTAPNCEISIEVDPRHVLAGDAAQWTDMGFTRISLGVQDVDSRVQQAINRIQPTTQVAFVVDEARAAGIQSINFDLVIGLPRQSVETMRQTLQWLETLRPDRVALYQYAHMPARFPAQRAIEDADLPSIAERFDMQKICSTSLQAAGYVNIGLDHYALPNDELSQALHDGRLRRNFQGYTVLGESDLLGFGVSSISNAGRCMVQNDRDIESYKNRIDRSESPITRGLLRSDDDQIRSRVINRLMCERALDTRLIGCEEHLDFSSYFADSITRLQQLDPEQNFLDRSGTVWTVTENGQEFLRLLAQCFDRYSGGARPANSPHAPQRAGLS